MHALVGCVHGAPWHTKGAFQDVRAYETVMNNSWLPGLAVYEDVIARGCRVVPHGANVETVSVQIALVWDVERVDDVW